jgi:hypothetical protein
VQYEYDPDEVLEVWPYSPVKVLPVWRLLWAAEDALMDGPEDREVMPRVVVRLRRLRNRLYWAGCWEHGKRIALPTTEELDAALYDLHEVIKREAWKPDQLPAVQDRLANSAAAARAARRCWDDVGLADEE